MAEEAERAEWNRTASLLAMLHNVNSTSRTARATLYDYHPYLDAPKGNVEMLKQFVKEAE